MSIIRAILVILAVSFTSKANAQGMIVSFDAGTDFYSQYWWRGFVLANKPTLQPSLTLGLGGTGLAFNIWGSMATADRKKGLDAADELDFTLSLDRSFGVVGISYGYIQYTFPNAPKGAKHSEEFYVGLSIDSPAAPSVTVYHDFGLADASYLSLGIGPEFPLGEAASLGIGVNLGFSNYNNQSFGFNDFNVSASVGITRGVATFSPSIGFSVTDENIVGTGADKEEAWVGFGIFFSI